MGNSSNKQEDFTDNIYQIPNPNNNQDFDQETSALCCTSNAIKDVKEIKHSGSQKSVTFNDENDKSAVNRKIEIEKANRRLSKGPIGSPKKRTLTTNKEALRLLNPEEIPSDKKILANIPNDAFVGRSVLQSPLVKLSPNRFSYSGVTPKRTYHPENTTFNSSRDSKDLTVRPGTNYEDSIQTKLFFAENE